MLDVYQGTIGIKTDVENIKKELIDYLIKTDEDLSYGVKTEKSIPIIITGKNDEEQKIPTFYHPVILEYRNDTYVCMDMRLFVSKPKDGTESITKLIKDQNNGKLALYRFILTKMFVDGNTRFLLAVNKQVYAMFQTVISNIYQNALMDGSLSVYVMLGTNYHYLGLDNDNIDRKHIEHQLFDFVLQNVKLVKPELLDVLKNDSEIPTPSKTIGDFIETMTELGINTRIPKMTSDILMLTLGRSFFALNNSELAIAMMENKATMIALFYNAITNSLNKKSIMAKTLNFRKRALKLYDFVGTMSNVFEDQISKF